MKRITLLPLLTALSLMATGCYTQLQTFEPVYRGYDDREEQYVERTEGGDRYYSDYELPTYDNEDYVAGYYEGFHEGSLYYRDLSYRPRWASYSSGPWDSYYPSYHFPSHYYSPSWSIGIDGIARIGASASTRLLFRPLVILPIQLRLGHGLQPMGIRLVLPTGWYNRPYTQIVYVDLDREYRNGRRSSGVDRDFGDNRGTRRYDGYGSGVTGAVAAPGVSLRYRWCRPEPQHGNRWPHQRRPAHLAPQVRYARRRLPVLPVVAR